MLREIPPLQILCLRAIGPPTCSFEDTFAKSKDGQPSTASRLIRSFHKRHVGSATTAAVAAAAVPTTNAADKDNTDAVSDIEIIPMERTPCIGTGSARRIHANDVDLHHPIAASRLNGTLVLEHGNPALDCLQSYPDSLVELGRMDDARLGLHFFQEWRANVLLAAGHPLTEPPAAVTAAAAATAGGKKRRRSGTVAVAAPSQAELTQVQYDKAPTASLSLYNCTLSTDTIEAMVASGMGPHISCLDLTGTHGLNDDLLFILLPVCSNLQRLSLKNCRRITDTALQLLAEHCPKLVSLDVGGAFNMTTATVLDVTVPALEHLQELHASGMGWNNDSIAAVTTMREWKALSLGFSMRLTQSSIRQSLMDCSASLTALSLPFCESVVDNALMGVLGRNLPFVKYLDLRGNSSLSTITGWYDGRASADLGEQFLLMLARYSGLQESSVEETRRIHPLEASKDMLTVILDGGGMGAGICRVEEEATPPKASLLDSKTNR